MGVPCSSDNLSAFPPPAAEARSYQRLNCACSRPVLVETMSRLRRAVEKLRASRAPTTAPAFAPLSRESTPPDADTGTPGDATPASASPPRPNSSPRKTRWPEPPDPERYAEAGSLLEVRHAWPGAPPMPLPLVPLLSCHACLYPIG